ncbi:hypothetical protein ABI_37480 [Asticcacaulis biprosthecium C19]|uniref:Uncharacterized protein n=1 Tax=Asticcacaulis biprosthecium C19 TaxID=715226 RepID=F4QR79_9CAUL|nr:hypothetical protein [Asticcacaulis biprosthecium]EGF90716.1 hypothetical protein ABI_37480 [Asticcacaulis biprosthecium C19]
MSRSRITITFDETSRIFVARYFGEIEGDDINDGMMGQLLKVDEIWTYDCIIDMRRYDGTVLVGEIEDLGKRWALFANGRDRGCFTAIISDDSLVRARLPVTQSLFPTRTTELFNSFDEGLDWIKVQRGYLQKALAV